MDAVRRLLRNKQVRLVFVVLIVGLTFGLFVYYLLTHPEAIKSISRLSPLTLGLLTLAYIGTVIANAFVLFASLRLIKKPVGFLENVALTGYSSVVNFFGPLQSGPGFRAAYLKSKHGVGLKRFLYVTVIFYGFFAMINALIIVGAILFTASPNLIPALFITILAVGLVGCLVILKVPRMLNALKNVNLTNINVLYIGFGALLLSAATATAYFIELNHVDPSVTVGQTIIYTAAANLALFVSLTPGAIGFRESFLLLSQQLHGISTDTVIAASVIDRAFYVVFLLFVFVLLITVGARSRLRKRS
jgi:uncharacterized membrane protein YbhN (UPF0104 family)